MSPQHARMLNRLCLYDHYHVNIVMTDEGSYHDMAHTHVEFISLFDRIKLPNVLLKSLPLVWLIHMRDQIQTGNHGFIGGRGGVSASRAGTACCRPRMQILKLIKKGFQTDEISQLER